MEARGKLIGRADRVFISPKAAGDGVTHSAERTHSATSTSIPDRLRSPIAKTVIDRLSQTSRCFVSYKVPSSLSAVALQISLYLVAM